MKFVQKSSGNHGYGAHLFYTIAWDTLSLELPQGYGLRARTVRAADQRDIVKWRIRGNLRAENSCPQYMNYPDWNFFIRTLTSQYANHNLQRKNKKLYFQDFSHFKTKLKPSSSSCLLLLCECVKHLFGTSCRTQLKTLVFFTRIMCQFFCSNVVFLGSKNAALYQSNSELHLEEFCNHSCPPFLYNL